MSDRKIIEVKVTYDEPHIAKSYGSDMIYYGPGPQLYPETTPQRVIEQAQEMLNKYSKDYTDLNFQPVRDCGCYHDCSCSPSYRLYGKRIETNLEYEYRRSREAAYIATQKAREIAEYERLKKKFENKVE